MFIELKNEIKSENDIDYDNTESSIETCSFFENRSKLTSLDFHDRLNCNEIYLDKNNPEMLNNFYSFKLEIEKVIPENLIPYWIF